VIPVGESIQLIGYLDKRRLNSRILGWLEGEYIVVSFPASNNEGEEVNLPKDAAVVCRGMIDGRMHGFKTHVLHSMTQPFEYLFLDYPSDMEDLSGNKGFRLDIEIPATAIPVENDAEAPGASAKGIDVTIQNMSVSGAIVRWPENLELEIFDTVFLSFQLPDGNSVENLKAAVRKDIMLQDDSSFGVEFNDEDSEFGPVFDFLLLANKIISQSEA
jgi:hypothetical protein